MAPMQPKKYLQVFGCFFSLLSVVGIPFYLVTATRWETVFGVGGVIGYLLMQSFVFFVPLSFAVTMRRMIVKNLTRLPKNGGLDCSCLCRRFLAGPCSRLGVVGPYKGLAPLGFCGKGRNSGRCSAPGKGRGETVSDRRNRGTKITHDNRLWRGGTFRPGGW